MGVEATYKWVGHCNIASQHYSATARRYPSRTSSTVQLRHGGAGLEARVRVQDSTLVPASGDGQTRGRCLAPVVSTSSRGSVRNPGPNRATVPCTSRHPPRTLLRPSGCTRVSEQCCIGTCTRYAVCTPRGALSTQGRQACGGRGHVGPSTAAAAIQRALSTSSCDAAHRAACEDTHTTLANACERWCCVAMRHHAVDVPLRPQ
jgi:hypothetical protein